MGLEDFSKKTSFIVGFVLFLTVSFSLAADLIKVKGKVKNEDGKNINNAKIQAEQSGKIVATATTNAKGEFELEVELGEYTISAEADGYTSAKVASELSKNKKANIELVLAQAFALIRGTVFTERGFSFPNALVVIEITNSDKKFRKEYTTNQSGEFAFRVPNTGNYLLTASAKGYKNDSKNIEINLGESRNLALSLMPEKNR